MGKVTELLEKYAPSLYDSIRSDVRGGFMNDIHEATIGTMMAEGLGRAEAELAYEDRGWLNRSSSVTQPGDQQPLARVATINRARMYSATDPMAVVSLRTWNNYTLGIGMSFKADDAGLQAKLETFWKHRKNRGVTSAAGQHKSNRRLLVDADIFFAIYDDSEGEDSAGALIRRLEATQVTHIITDPEDVDVPLLYRRQFSYNGKDTVWYYRDWAFSDHDLEGVLDPVSGRAIDESMVQDAADVVVYHLAFNAMYQRGQSLIAPATPWMGALRQFMEDRFAITSGLAKFIRKIVVKGGKAQLDKAVNAVKSAVGMNNGRPTMGTPEAVRTAASTFMGNENVDMQDMPRTTGASDARQDYRNGRLNVLAFTGLTEPYTGDAESGNLATATAMELPMLKQFQTHQQMWIEAWLDIFSIVANFAKPVPVTVDIDMPPIILDNVLQWAQACAALLLSMPELKQPEVMREALTQLGINNVDEVMVLVEKLAKENKDFADKQKKQMLENPQPAQNGPAKPVAKPAQEAAVELLANLLAEIAEGSNDPQ